MASFTLGILVPFMVIGPLYGKIVKKIKKEVSDAQAKASDIAEEALGNIRVVKCHATEDLETQNFLKGVTDVYNAEFWDAVAYGCFSGFMSVLMFGTLDALVFFAGYLNING